MSKEVLLMADVAKLGVEGDVVTVTDGYARNCLIPQKLAAPVTDATRRRLVKIQESRAAEREGVLAELKKRAEELSKVSCTIAVKTGDDDAMYGSVGAGEIAAALKEQDVEIDKHSLVLDENIKDLGVFDIKVKLDPEVEATIKVWIVEE